MKEWRPDPKPEPRPKRPRLPLKRVAIKKKYNPTGEKEIFREVWSERNHVCINCGYYLSEPAIATYFAHILSKKKHPELRLEKTNIFLLCIQCHHEYDHGTKESYANRTNLYKK